MTGQHEESVCSVFMFDVAFNEMLGTFYDFVCQCSTMPFIRYNVFLKSLNSVLNPTCHLLALLEARHILHVSRIRVK